MAKKISKKLNKSQKSLLQLIRKLIISEAQDI